MCHPALWSELTSLGKSCSSVYVWRTRYLPLLLSFPGQFLAHQSGSSLLSSGTCSPSAWCQGKHTAMCQLPIQLGSRPDTADLLDSIVSWQLEFLTSSLSSWGESLASSCPSWGVPIFFLVSFQGWFPSSAWQFCGALSNGSWWQSHPVSWTEWSWLWLLMPPAITGLTMAVNYFQLSSWKL